MAKVLAALILHSYQNYALCFTSRFPLFHSRPMEWSEEHDVLFLREMLARNIFGAKKGSPARGLAWEAIVDSLNEIHSPKFQLKDKKAVRERWNLLRKSASLFAMEHCGNQCKASARRRRSAFSTRNSALQSAELMFSRSKTSYD